MKGLAALRSALAFVCLPLLAAACGGGSSAPSAVPAPQSAQQSTVGTAGALSSGVARLAGGARPAGCTPFPGKAPDLPAPCTMYLGGFISPTVGETPAEQIASTANFEQQIGRKLSMDLHYYQWTDSFPGIAEADDLKNGRIPFISWHCGTTDANVISGNADALLTKRAQALAAYGGPVFLRYKWEMNLLYNPKCEDKVNDTGGHYNRQYFIYAWQHIRAIFAANGATNVVWVFNPSASGQPPDPYYPGDSEVDWIAFDHYDTSATQSFYTTFSQTQIQSGAALYTYPYFATSFGGPHPWGVKPLIVGETGALQGNQQSFLNAADAALQQQFPNIQAFFYWDSKGERGDYRLQQFGIQAFTQFAAGPYEQGKYQH